MTDLDTFRDALHHTGDGRPPALDEIITAGRRLRLRRRLLGAVAATTALVVAAAAGIALWPSPARHRDVPAAAWPAVSVDAQGTWGQAVTTGLRHDNRDIVVTAFHNVNPAYPDIPFGVRSCVVDVRGRLDPCKSTFDDGPPDRSPGFHAINLPSNIGDVDLPMFGYYVGPAATITVRARGKVVTAQTSRWSADNSVVLFWFTLRDAYLKVDKTDPSYGTGPVGRDVLPEVTNWTAYDREGTELPVGKPFVIG
jgi:hypothetical protein